VSGDDIPVLDLDDLDPGARAWLERLVASGSMLLHRGGESLGAVSFTPSVLEGTVVGAAVSSSRTHTDTLPDGVKVLATTMKLRPEARERLRESFGPDWVVLDFHDAPDTADAVLTAAHSPQLIHRWTLLFPQAQIIVTEILDNEFGLDVGGPVGRLMDAGAHAYLPPRPLEQVAQNVQSYLETRAHTELGSAAPIIHQIGS
jgi:hypothetical protein